MHCTDSARVQRRAHPGSVRLLRFGKLGTMDGGGDPSTGPGKRPRRALPKINTFDGWSPSSIYHMPRSPVSGGPSHVPPERALGTSMSTPGSCAPLRGPTPPCSPPAGRPPLHPPTPPHATEIWEKEREQKLARRAKREARMHAMVVPPTGGEVPGSGLPSPSVASPAGLLGVAVRVRVCIPPADPLLHA